MDERDALEAVRRHVTERGEAPKMGLPASGDVTWHSLLEGTVVRCVENRSEDERTHRGRIDLSDRPQYDTLAEHPLAPPASADDASTLKLVRRGTVNEESCPCGNGKVPCSRCGGPGSLRCEATEVCGDCRGIDSCLSCDGTGHRARKSRDEARRTADERIACKTADERIACKKCGALDAACPTCRGRGHIRCTTCQGTGVRPCPDCEGEGTEEHKRCAGTGHLVTWTEGVVSRRPQTEKVKWPTTGLPFLARWYAREHGAWSAVTLTHHDAVPDDLDDEFTALLKPHLKPHRREVAREADLRYLPLARVAVPEHRHRVYYVCPDSRVLRVFVLPSAQRTWQIAGAATAALTVLCLLLRWWA